MFSTPNLLLLLDKLDDVVFEINSAGQWAYLNSAWNRFTGFSVKESLGQAAAKFVHPGHVERFNLILQQAFTGGQEAGQQEFLFLTRTGDYRCLKIDARLLEQAGGGLPS